MQGTGKTSKKAAGLGPWTEAQLDRFIERATLDAYGEYEQRVALFTMLEGGLRLPFETEILGAVVTVEAIDLTRDDEIVAICRRDRSRQRIPILDLPLPNPRPTGAKWIAATVGGAGAWGATGDVTR